MKSNIMNATTTLSKIMSLLGIEKDVNLSGDVYGKLENGDIVASDFFDVGHVLFVLDEAGSKLKAKDGEYKLLTPGNQTDGPTTFRVKVKDSVIEQMDEIREDAEAKKQPTLSKTNGLAPNTNLSKQNLESMDNKMKMEEVEKLQEPLKDLPASDKDAMKAEIEDIKKSLAALQEALASLMKEKEAEMASQKDEGMNDEKKAVEKEEEMYAYGKNNEEKQRKGLEAKGSQNQNLSAIKNQLFKGAPVEPTNTANVKLNTQSVETSFDRVLKRLAN
jgi:hypothetical protein